LHNLIQRTQSLPIHDSRNWTFVSDLLADGSNAGYVTNALRLERMHDFSYKTSNFTVLSEKILTNYQGFVFDPSHHIFKGFNRKIVQMVEAGIAQYLVEKETTQYKKNEPPEGPVVINLNHIDVWFHIWAVFLGFALSFLICEFIAAKLRKRFDEYLTSNLIPDTRLFIKQKHLSTKAEVKNSNNRKRSQRKYLTKPNTKPKVELMD
jgi:hypothetical protein